MNEMLKKEMHRPVAINPDTKALIKLSEWMKMVGSNTYSMIKPLVFLNSTITGCSQGQTELALARLDAEEEGELEFEVLGKGPLTKEQALDEVRRGTLIGKKIVKIEIRSVGLILEEARKAVKEGYVPS